MATNRLGKGIDALIRPPEKQDISPAGVTTIPISKIKANPHENILITKRWMNWPHL